MIITCPGCGETYDPTIKEFSVDLSKFDTVYGDERYREAGVVDIPVERFTGPDGTIYCCYDCFEVNG